MTLALRGVLFLWLAGGLMATEAVAPDAPNPIRRVELGVYILNLTELDEPGQRVSAQLLLGAYWQDPSLAEAGATAQVWREGAALEKSNEIWNPMVEFNRTTEPAEVEHALLRIHPDGKVEFERLMNVQISTELDLRELPFDTQYLQLELESFQHQAEVMELTLAAEDLRIARRISLPQWQVKNLRADSKTYFNDLYDENYGRVTVTIEVDRRFEFYIWQMMVPLGILIGVAFAVFFLPLHDLADRMGVIVASLLTIVALSYALHAELPKVSYLTVIDWLFVFTYVALGLVMAAMVWVRRLADRDEALATRIDRWLRWFCPAAYLLAAGIVIGVALR